MPRAPASVVAYHFFPFLQTEAPKLRTRTRSRRSTHTNAHKHTKLRAAASCRHMPVCVPRPFQSCTRRCRARRRVQRGKRCVLQVGPSAGKASLYRDKGLRRGGHVKKGGRSQVHWRGGAHDCRLSPWNKKTEEKKEEGRRALGKAAPADPPISEE